MKFSLLNIRYLLFFSDEFHVSGQESSDDCDYYTLSDEDYDDCIDQQKQCKIFDGTPCVFPFMFKGKERTQCISTRRRIQPWCPTQVDSSTRIPVRGEWGYCEPQCQSEGSESGTYFFKIPNIIMINNQRGILCACIFIHPFVPIN